MGCEGRAISAVPSCQSKLSIANIDTKDCQCLRPALMMQLAIRDDGNAIPGRHA